MQRTRIENRWQLEKWEVQRVEPDTPDANDANDANTAAAAACIIYQDRSRAQWLHPGFLLSLRRDEAEGYFLNLSTAQPFAFVMWREDEGAAVPRAVTASYNEAARMLDAGENVDGVPMPREWVDWLSGFVAEHYKPEPKKRRIRPPSFKGAWRDER